jgi:hypothetical protein
MNRELYIEYLKNPEKLDAESLDKIRLILDEYPYFQTNRLLYVKNLHNLKDVRFDSQLKLSAVYAPNREKLYFLINPHNIPNLIDTKSIGLEDSTYNPDEKLLDSTESIKEEINTKTKLPETKSIKNDLEDIASSSTSDSNNTVLVIDNKDNKAPEIEDASQNEETNLEVSNVLPEEKEQIEQNINDTTINIEEDSVLEDSSDSLTEKPDYIDIEDVEKPSPSELIAQDSSSEIDTPSSDEHKVLSEKTDISDDLSDGSHISDLILQKIKIAKGEEEYNPQVDRQTEDNKAELLKKIQDRLNEINSEKDSVQKTTDAIKTEEGMLEENSNTTLELETKPEDIPLNNIPEEVDHPEEQCEDFSNQSLKPPENVSDIISDKIDLQNTQEPEELIENAANSTEKFLKEPTKTRLEESESNLLDNDFDDFIDADDLFEKRDTKKTLTDKKMIPPLEISSYNNEDIVKNNEKIQEKKTKKIDLIDKFISENKSSLNMTTSVSEDGSEPEFQLPPQEEFFSETLAKIYIKQGHYERALLTYEKLYLKYPEKSVYFASQINKVKEFLKNKNN